MESNVSGGFLWGYKLNFVSSFPSFETCLLLNLSAMNANRLASCLCGAIIGSLGFFYFLVYTLQFLLFHMPSSPEVVPATLAVLLFALSVAFCHLYTSVHFFLGLISDEPLAEERQLITLVGIISIWASALPTVAFLLPAWSWIQVGYMAGFTVVVLGHLPRSFRRTLQRNEPGPSTPLAVLSIIMLSLTPTIHALVGPASLPTTLAIAFTKLLVSNILGLVIFLLQPLEMLGMAHRWRASFHVMYLIATFTVIAYSQEVMRTATTQKVG